MLFGIFFVFFTVILMNHEGTDLKQNTTKESSELNVQKLVKPKPKPKPEPKKKPEPSKPKRTAPAPTLSSSLSGIDTGLDAFMSNELNMDESLLGDVSKNMVMSEDSVDSAPQPTQRSAMEYPKQARKMGVSGYVLMNLLVNKEGEVEKVKVLESEPEGIFDEAAIEGVKSWQFKPAQYKGEAVKVWAKQKIRFDLQ
ncbi:energy transducer TonB [bacterium]|nr:energy transducer TonB [bacterium]MBU1995007.1 energy transducer TonB [bacterium]